MLTFRPDDYLLVEEAGLKLDGDGDLIRTELMIRENEENILYLVEGECIPFRVYFEYDSRTKKYCAVMEVDLKTIGGEDRTRRLRSEHVLERGKMYLLEVVLLDGECYILADGEPVLRHMFTGTYAKKNYGKLCFGGANHPSGFRMKSLEFVSDIYQENDVRVQEILSKAVEDSFMVRHSAPMNYLDEGIDIGEYAGYSPKRDWENYEVFQFRKDDVYKELVVLSGSRYMILSEEIYSYYSTHNMDDMLIAEVTLIPGKVVLAQFTNVCVFYYIPTKMYSEITGGIMERYLSCDLADYDYWYPYIFEGSHGDSYEKDGMTVSYMPFSNGLVICEVIDQNEAREPYTVIMKKEMITVRDVDGHYAIVVPLADYTVTYDEKGKPFLYTLACKEGWIHSVPAWNYTVFVDKDLGAASEKGIREVTRKNRYDALCIDFEGGVMAAYPEIDKVCLHTNFLMKLAKVTCGKIDDGINSIPELYLRLYVTSSEGTKAWNVDLGKHSYYDGSTHYTFNTKDGYNVFTLDKMTADSYMRVTIHLYDYDPGPANENDYIGTFDYVFDISNGWGIDHSNSYGVYTLPMTTEGKDNRGGLWNAVLMMSVAEKYDLEELKKNWKKNLGFHFRNFTGSYKFTKGEFGRLFKNVFAINDASHSWWRLDALTSEGIFYSMCAKGADYAKCYGFAVAEAEAYHGMGLFIPPLSRFGLAQGCTKSLTGDDLTFADMEPTIGRWIVDSWYRGFGWDSMMYEWRKINSGIAENPLRAIEEVKAIIAAEGCCIVNVFPKITEIDPGEGHSVLAYRWEGEGWDTKFFVLDCNKPFDSKYDNYSIPKSETWISFVKKGDKIDRIQFFYYNGAYHYRKECYFDTDYQVILGVPFAVAAKEPRIPSWSEVTAGGLGNMVMGWIDGIGSLITGSNASGIIYDKNTLNTEEIFFPMIASAGGKTGQRRFFLVKNGDANLTFRGEKQGSTTVTLLSAGGKVTLDTRMKEGEELTVSYEKLTDVRRMRLGMKRTGDAEKVSFRVEKRRDSKLCEFRYKEELEVDRGGLEIQGKTFGTRLVAKRWKENGVELPSVQLKPKRNIRETYAPPHARPRKEAGARIANKRLTVKQCAAIYGCSKSTVQQMCRNAQIPGAFKEKRKWVIPGREQLVTYR
ncbi:MAG: helix-turn-helix domain-containing protein [Lachnospiraceae bacterium]|nr:helix-turn-helix domain-containing protein [Lachnospiraceae bacterium]